MSFYREFAEHYERIFPFRVATCEFLKRHLPAAGHVLDVGCGTGHYCGRLAESGLDATGIDLDEGMIAQARQAYPQPRFDVRNMLDLAGLDSSFEAAWCIGNVAPHVPVADLLPSITQVLEPGAVWILQTVNFDPLLDHDSFDFPLLSFDEGRAVFHREYLDITQERLRFVTRLVIDGAEVFSGEVELSPTRSDEVIRLHEAAGFSFKSHWADFKETPFDTTKTSGSVYVFKRNP